MNEFFATTTATRWRGYGHSLGGANNIIATVLAKECCKFKVIDAITFGTLSVMDLDGDKYFRSHNIVPRNYMYVDDPVAKYTAYLHTMLNTRYTVRQCGQQTDGLTDRRLVRYQTDRPIRAVGLTAFGSV
jgi:hypothetical protein